MVIQAIKPWFSTVDIDKGEAWLTAIQTSLSESKGMGVFCMTPDNVSAPWLAFEAGALASQDRGRVATFLHGVDASAIKPPISLFQATNAIEREDVFNLLRNLNGRLESPLDAGLLQRTFDANWNDLQTRLSAILPATKKARPSADSSSEMLTEILNTVRRLERIGADQELLADAVDQELRVKEAQRRRRIIGEEPIDDPRALIMRKKRIWAQVKPLDPKEAYPFPPSTLE